MSTAIEYFDKEAGLVSASRRLGSADKLKQVLGTMRRVPKKMAGANLAQKAKNPARAAREARTKRIGDAYNGDHFSNLGRAAKMRTAANPTPFNKLMSKDVF